MKNVLLAILTLTMFRAGAQAPANYYTSANGLTCAQLKTALKNIITNGHTNQGYTALWSQFMISDLKPREVGTGSTNVIWDIYSDNPTGTDPYNFTPGTGTGGQQDQGSGGGSEGQYYNREHSVPLSWHSGSTSSFSGSDYYHIFPTDKKVNAERANFPYGKVATASWTSLNGSKLGSSAVAGISGTVFEPIDTYKGDVARAFLYFVTRYESDMPSWGSNSDAAQAFEPNTFPSVDLAFLRLMIQWHQLDPVSQKEIDRNNAGYTFQGNRNPFVDNPAYVEQVWNAACPGLSALPVDVISFIGILEGSQVKLQWDVANEINLAHYEVERSFNGTNYQPIGQVKAAGVASYRFHDGIDQHRGRRIYYRIKQVDVDGKFRYTPVFSIHIPMNKTFSVYPNPARDIVRLQLSEQVRETTLVQVTDLSGKVVLSGTFTPVNGLLTIPVNTIAAGNYVIRIRVGDDWQSQRLVIVK